MNRQTDLVSEAVSKAQADSESQQMDALKQTLQTAMKPHSEQSPLAPLTDTISKAISKKQAGSDSQQLDALRQTLQTAIDQHSGQLPLNVLTGTVGEPLLELFSDYYNISTFTLTANVILSPVENMTLTVTGSGPINTKTADLSLMFWDLNGQIKIRALFQNPDFQALSDMFPSLPSDFFQGIKTPGTMPTVDIVYGTPTLKFSNAIYGVSGYVVPASDLNVMFIAPQIQGDIAGPSGPIALGMELASQTNGWYLYSVKDGVWGYPELNWLLPDVQVTENFPGIVSADAVNVSQFQLYFYPDAPSFSFLCLKVVDKTNPDNPIWVADEGKIKLMNVLVGIGLNNTPQKITGNSPSSGFVQGDFMLGSVELIVQIPYPLNDGPWVVVSYPDLPLADGLKDIAVLLDSGQSFDDLMPAGLAKVLNAFELSYLYLAVEPTKFALDQFTMRLSTTNPWNLIPNVLSLDQLTVQMSVNKAGLTGGVQAHFLIGESDVYLMLQRYTPNGPWFFTVNSPVIPLPSLGDLATLANGTDLSQFIQASGLDKLHFIIYDLNIGMTFDPQKLTSLGLTLQLANADSPTDPSLEWEIIPNILILRNFSVGFQLAWEPDFQADVTGFFTLNTLNFSIKFGQGTQGDAFIAAYSPADDETGKVDLQTLISGISEEIAKIVPAGLDIQLDDAFVAYINTNGVKKFLFTMDVAIDLPISNIPLIGDALSKDAKVQITDLKVTVASDAFSASDVGLVNQLIGTMPPEMKVAPLPLPAVGQNGEAIIKGFSVAATLQLGNQKILITAPVADQSQQLSAPPTELSVLRASASQMSASAPSYASTMWINVQKSFGPVNVQKIGFNYSDGKLYLMLNVGLSTGGLTIDLLGLGIGSSLTELDVSLILDGLAVSFAEGPVMIAGGMLGTIDPVNFVGMLTIKAGIFNLMAFGGYSSIDGNPSMFLYGIMNNPPLGGPPPFFVRGLAGGFGFNRNLLIPDVSQIYSFPFVSWATNPSAAPSFDPSKSIGDQVATSLQVLIDRGIVAPSVGSYWLAGGVLFTSFEILSSFALLTIRFGTQFEIDLLGLSTMQIPPEDPAPVAEIQMAIKVAFAPSSGLFSFAGQLTPNSFILSNACRLTGGFAYYLWFGGDHKGEFIVTFGGYNSNFPVPAYYPVVPRLGYSLGLGPLSFSGEFYFALTNNCIFAGGKLSSVWQAGPIRAWFMVWADFLMVFEPFHYYIDAGIDMGVSFSIKLLFFRITLTIHIGVELSLWGPEFQGKAVVDLAIISFTIDFSKTDPNANQTIPWPDFIKKLLPSSQGKMQARAGLVAPQSNPQAVVVQVNITQGLIKQINDSADNPMFLVDGQTFSCTVATVIPSKTASFQGSIALAPDSMQPCDQNGVVITPTTDFGVGPVGLDPDQFQPDLSISLSDHEDSQFYAIRQLQNAPKGYWEKKKFDANGVPVVDNSAATDSTIANTLIGFSLVPYVPDPDHTYKAKLVNLEYTIDDNIQRFVWSSPWFATTDPFKTETVANTILKPSVVSVRNVLFDAMRVENLIIDSNINVTGLQDANGNDLVDNPQYQLLGEQKYA